MNKMLKVILPIILISMLLIAGCSSEPEPDISGIGLITACAEYSGQGLQIGDPAPDFQFQNAAGQTIALSDLRDKPVLVNFWATWCGPCNTELPFIQQIYDEWQERELVVLAIDIGESPSQVAEFMQNKGLSFPVLLDSEMKAAAQYQALYIPTTLVIDKDGIIQGIQVGAFQSKEQIESILSQLD